MNWYKKHEIKRLVTLAALPFNPSPTQSTLPQPPQPQQVAGQPTEAELQQIGQSLAAGWIRTMPGDGDLNNMVAESLTKVSRSYAPNKNQSAQKTRDDLAKLTYYYVECTYFAKQIAIYVGQNSGPVQDLIPINQATNNIAMYPDAGSMSKRLSETFRNIGKGNDVSAKALGYAMEFFKDSYRDTSLQIVKDRVGDIIKTLPQDAKTKVKNIDNMSKKEQMLNRRVAQDFMDAVAIVLRNPTSFPKQLVQEVQKLRNTAINQWLKTLPGNYFTGQAVSRTVTMAPGYGTPGGAQGSPAAPATSAPTTTSAT